MSEHNNDVFERGDKQQLDAMMKDRDKVKMVRAFMQRSSRYREPFLELARQSRSLYETWQPTSRSMIQRANLKLPFGFSIIETELPQMVDIFFKDDDVFSFAGNDPQDAQWENALTDFHKKQLKDMKIVPKSTQFFKSTALDGTGIAKIPYKFAELEVTRRVPSVDPLTGETTMEKIPERVVTFDGPDLEVIPIFDFFPDWSIKMPGDVQAMRGCVHRTWSTIAALKDKGIYKNLKELQLSLTTKGSAAWTKPYFATDDYKQQFERLQDSWQQGIKDAGKIELWEYWGLYDPQGDGKFEEYVITIANGDVIVRCEPNFYDYKFKPFVACPNYIRDNEFYGIPELVALKYLIKEANTLRNARLDNVNMSVNPMWILDRASGVNVKSLYSRPNGVVWTNDMNGIKPIQLPDPSQGSQTELQNLQLDIQNASGNLTSSPQIGQLAKTFGRSATGSSLVASMATNRTGLKARLFGEYYFKQLAWIMLMTNRQFVTEEQWVRLNDPNSPNPFTMLPPDAFFRNYDFSVATDLDSGGKEGQFQKIQTAFQAAQLMENSQPGTIKGDVFVEALLRPLLGNQVSRFVRTDEERLQMQQQNLAMQQATNAAEGQNAPQPNDLSALLGGPTEV